VNALYTKLCIVYPKPHKSFRLIHPKKKYCLECKKAHDAMVVSALKAVPRHKKPVSDDTELRIEDLGAALRIWLAMDKAEWSI